MLRKLVGNKERISEWQNRFPIRVIILNGLLSVRSWILKQRNLRESELLRILKVSKTLNVGRKGIPLAFYLLDCMKISRDRVY